MPQPGEVGANPARDRCRDYPSQAASALNETLPPFNRIELKTDGLGKTMAVIVVSDLEAKFGRKVGPASNLVRQGRRVTIHAPLTILRCAPFWAVVSARISVVIRCVHDRVCARS